MSNLPVLGDSNTSHGSVFGGQVNVGLDDEVGAIRDGMLADLPVIDGDPLQDVALIKDRARLRLILAGGRSIKNRL
jgi:imidazolonepropionase-like amidohydrolase